MESTCKPKIVSSLLRESGKGKLDFSHPFQRKEGQWTRYMESLEVDSLLRGYSINLVYVWKKDNKNYVIEGKQRITTLQKYKGDKFPLSKKLDPVIVDGETYEIAGKRFSQLDEVVQDKLLNSVILYTACSRVRALSSRTYLPRTRGKALVLHTTGKPVSLSRKQSCHTCQGHPYHHSFSNVVQ